MTARGAAAEAQAADYLVRQGLRIVARNWRCRQGEIDLIARDGATLVFVEVRARADSRFGGAAASITAAKQARIAAAARHYLMTVSPLPPCRFDAVCIDGGRLQWLKNCFDAAG
ncbi:YraN family protein [Chitiniphilus purpureus]|uniref:UPF0102 protein N8I74_06905 n=1 Tax=Chitiniphilus purpureus TaxID=2981137 RepID=A0ABY6DQW5_9NEIS|nr:YraN family protein [Chitiniphilus sp. CD1]UXY16744.1 YraN family protein [Chitiniphilus sp. CD1]